MITFTDKHVADTYAANKGPGHTVRGFLNEVKDANGKLIFSNYAWAVEGPKAKILDSETFRLELEAMFNIR